MPNFDDFFEHYRQPWRPLSRAALIAWLTFYSLLLIYAWSGGGGFLLIDNVNLIVHEAGHLLFSYLGHTLMICGGTILQLFVPLALAAYFAYLRQPAATAFCGFFFFENFLYISVYMADARAQALPLVTVGDSDYVEHDWNYIFSSLVVLQHDLGIAAVVGFLGWLGMIATMGWLAWRASRSARAISTRAARA